MDDFRGVCGKKDVLIDVLDKSKVSDFSAPRPYFWFS
jgi:hypothetical protein